jgi:hypothetical protein
MTRRTIPERVAALETFNDEVIKRMIDRMDEIYLFISNHEKETERIAAKKIADHEQKTDARSQAHLNWRKIGVIVHIIAQYGLILWIINTIYNGSP